MEHYYVVNGNEYGIDINTKKNFTNLEDAKNHFESIKFDDFYSRLVYVNQSGIEDIVEEIILD